MREDFNRGTLMHDHMYIQYQHMKIMMSSAVFDQTFFFADLLVFLNLGAFTSALWIIHNVGRSEAHRSRHVWWDVMTCTFSMYYSDGRKIKSLQLVISSHVWYYIKVLSCSSKSECWCPIDGGRQWWFQQKTCWKKSNVNNITFYFY